MNKVKTCSVCGKPIFTKPNRIRKDKRCCCKSPQPTTQAEDKLQQMHEYAKYLYEFISNKDIRPMDNGETQRIIREWITCEQDMDRQTMKLDELISAFGYFYDKMTEYRTHILGTNKVSERPYNHETNNILESLGIKEEEKAQTTIVIELTRATITEFGEMPSKMIETLEQLVNTNPSFNLRIMLSYIYRSLAEVSQKYYALIEQRGMQKNPIPQTKGEEVN
jgi:hypothetical protein